MLIDLPNSAINIDFTHRAAVIAPYTERPIQPYLTYDLNKYRGAMRGEIPLAEAKINEIELMEANWDGYNAIIISSDTSKNAKNAIGKLCSYVPIPDISPNPNGTISFEWETQDGFAHLEIGRTKYSFYIKPRTGKAILADGYTKNIEINIGKWIAEILYPSTRGSETITKIIYLNNDLRTAY